MLLVLGPKTETRLDSSKFKKRINICMLRHSTFPNPHLSGLEMLRNASSVVFMKYNGVSTPLEPRPGDGR